MTKTVTVSPEVKQKLSHWYDADILDRVAVVQGSIPGRLFGTFGQHAVTINGTVHLTSSADDLESDKWDRTTGPRVLPRCTAATNGLVALPGQVHRRLASLPHQTRVETPPRSTRV
jgi:hypothetical protein